MTKIASFDVFDTVITRAFGTPISGAILLGNKLKGLSLIECSAEAFARLRIDAHYRAKKNIGGINSEVTLHQVYAELGNTLRLTETQREQLMNLEMKLEAELIRPIPRTRELVQAAREQNQKIVFLSDMYLGTEFIQKQLTQYGLYLEGDRCYVSCDHGKSKASGELFQELLASEGIAPNLISHCGDDLWSDVEAAKQVGLKVTPFVNAKLNRYEEILESYNWATEGLSSAMAGASRLARLTVPASSSKQEAQRDVAASVGAPVLVGYVLWILRRAQKLGLKRLYFVSRDGQILLAIARMLIKKLNFECELRYLYGSKKAWLFPSITSLKEQNQEQLSMLFSMDWVLKPVVSVRLALERFGIQPEEIKDILVSIRLTDKDWERHLSSDEQKHLIEVVTNNEIIHNLILEKAGHKRQVMINYLEQEGLLDGTEFGFVDLGNKGSLHYFLCSVLATSGGKLPVSFYLGLERKVLENEKFGRPECYFYDHKNNLGFVEEGILHSILEIFSSADHGTVVGYEEVEKRIEPIFKEKSGQLLMNWGYAIVRETICSFAENLLLDSSLINPWVDVRAASVDLLKEFYYNPSFLEAKAWGDLPVEWGLDHELVVTPIVGSYGWKHLIESLWNGGQTTWQNDLVWHSGTLALTSPILRTAFKFNIYFVEFLQRVKQRMNSKNT